MSYLRVLLSGLVAGVTVDAMRRRKLPMWEVAGGGAAALLGTYVAAGLLDGGASAPAMTPSPVLPGVQPKPPLAAPQKIEGAAIALDTGAVYQGAVDLGFIAERVANVDNVRAYAEKLGFRNVVVFEQGASPVAMPEDADYLVIGMWAGAPKSMARPSEIIEAWRV